MRRLGPGRGRYGRQSGVHTSDGSEEQGHAAGAEVVRPSGGPTLRALGWKWMRRPQARRDFR